jgi:hypothetical protein
MAAAAAQGNLEAAVEAEDMEMAAAVAKAGEMAAWRQQQHRETWRQQGRW